MIVVYLFLIMLSSVSTIERVPAARTLLTTISPLDILLSPPSTVAPDEYAKLFPSLSTPSFAVKTTKSPFEHNFRAAGGELVEMITLPTSPLDNGNRVDDNVQSGNKSLDRSLLSDMDQLSPCQKDCSKGLNEAISLIMQSMSHVERYHLICKNYEESYACIKEDQLCAEEDHGFFESFTSGLRYMCVDQSLAFNATINCIDAQASFVQGECETTCNTKNVVMNMIMRSSIAQGIQDGLMSGLNGGSVGAVRDASLNGFMQSAAQPQPLDMDGMRQMSSELCKVGDCVLECIRNKFNTRCEGSAGTLLSEVFVRPIAATQERMAMMSPVLGIFIPQPCNYLYSGAELAKHRIDPRMDDELKRMYQDREDERLALLRNASLETAASSDALLFTLPGAQSPFEGNTDLGSLVEQLYRSSNDTDNEMSESLDILGDVNSTDIIEANNTTQIPPVTSTMVKTDFVTMSITESPTTMDLLETRDVSGDGISGMSSGDGEVSVRSDDIDRPAVYRKLVNMSGNRTEMLIRAKRSGLLLCRVRRPQQI